MHEERNMMMMMKEIDELKVAEDLKATEELRVATEESKVAMEENLREMENKKKLIFMERSTMDEKKKTYVELCWDKCYI
jgi:hypothetical protein